MSFEVLGGLSNHELHDRVALGPFVTAPLSHVVAARQVGADAQL